MTPPISRRAIRAGALAAFAAAVAIAAAAPSPVVAAKQTTPKAPTSKAIFFASDGMREDLVKQYAAEGRMPAMNAMLKHGVRATGDGLQTQAPANTGAGWYTLATGAWSGVHGSTNNTFHQNGDPFGSSRSAFAPTSPQAESVAHSAEAAGLKVAQVDWTGGANAGISGPTIDYVSFASGRGVATNFIGGPGQAYLDDPTLISSFGLQFDTPDGYAGQAPFAGADPSPATGWTNVPTSHSPAMEMRLRVLDFGVDKYGLNAYLYDSTNNHKTDYNKVLFSTTKDGANAVGDLKQGQWADVKVTVSGGPLDGKTAGMLIKVERLTPDLSRVRLFHTSVTRANATWANWPGEPGYTDFAEYLAANFPTATESDFAILEAGITSEDTYVQQGLYWATARWPMMEYIAHTEHPDLMLVGVPTTDEFSHQFIGLISKWLPNGDANPAYDDIDFNGIADGRVHQRRNYIRAAYTKSDQTLAFAQSLMGGNPTTFVSSDHGFGPQFLAIDASQVLVNLGLLSTPQTSNCRPASTETIGKAKACWAGGTVQIYLNLEGRDPAGGGYQQVPAAAEASTVAAIKSAFADLSDPNDWTDDGQPEHWKMIDAVYTKAQTDAIPNGPGATADMHNATRTGDVVAFAYPPYQFDAETPGTLVAWSHFFGQHGWLPSLQNLHANVNMRATFLAGGPAIAHGLVRARSIDLAPTLAYLLGVPAPAQSEGKVLMRALAR